MKAHHTSKEKKEGSSRKNHSSESTSTMVEWSFNSFSSSISPQQDIQVDSSLELKVMGPSSKVMEFVLVTEDAALAALPDPSQGSTNSCSRISDHLLRDKT